MSPADEVQLEIFRRMSPQQKLDLAERLRQTNLDLLAAGIRAERPDIDAESLRMELLRRTLPERLFRAAYGPA